MGNAPETVVREIECFEGHADAQVCLQPLRGGCMDYGWPLSSEYGTHFKCQMIRDVLYVAAGQLSLECTILLLPAPAHLVLYGPISTDLEQSRLI